MGQNNEVSRKTQAKGVSKVALNDPDNSKQNKPAASKRKGEDEKQLLRKKQVGKGENFQEGVDQSHKNHWRRVNCLINK